MYAEDDPVIAELNRDMLEREGYVVDVVYNGEDAWEKYRQTTYHLLLLDIIMPGKSGFELLQAIRAEDTAMPVVIYSSVSGSEAVAKPWIWGLMNISVKNVSLRRYLPD